MFLIFAKNFKSLLWVARNMFIVHGPDRFIEIVNEESWAFFDNDFVGAFDASFLEVTCDLAFS